MAENARPGYTMAHESVPQIDLAMLLGSSAKKSKNKNKNKSTPTSTPTSLNSRTPMGAHNRMSGHGTPLGLLSPPSSQTNVLADDANSGLSLDQPRGPGQDKDREQDPARLLISPPPEELLQLANRRSSFNRTSIPHVNLISNTSDTGHMNAATSIQPPSLPKRKRSMAPTLPSTTAAATFESNDVSRRVGSSTVALASETGSDIQREGTLPPEATPNPKPRKQSKRIGRAHVRTNSNQSDLSMQSIPSPTRPSRSTLPSSLDQMDHTAGIAPIHTTTPRNDNSTSPRRTRNSHYHVVKSPHADNPDADYLPPLRLRLSDTTENTDDEDEDVLPTQARRAIRTGRRSATPLVIPPYEPPSEVFTPPREIVVSPVASSSKLKRKSGRTRALKVDVPVKKEAPDIDLSEPMPPASPTDDPLLLSGPPDELMSTPVRSRSRVMRDAGVLTASVRDGNQKERIRSMHRSPVRVEESLPPSSPPPHHNYEYSSSPIDQAPFQWFNEDHVNVDFVSTDSMDVDMHPDELAEVEGPLPDVGFDANGLPTATATYLNDSDDEDSLPVSRTPRTPLRISGIIDEGVGEYTGHWRLMEMRTKADPPSSATRMRIEEWGRPISPYPYVVDRSRRAPSREGMRTGSASPTPASRSNSSGALPFAEAEGDTTIHAPPSTKVVSGTSTGDDEEVRKMSFEPNVKNVSSGPQNEAGREEAGLLSMEAEQEEEEEEEVREMSIEPEYGNGDEEEEEEKEEEREVRAMSMEHDADEEEEREVREMSIEHDAETDLEVNASDKQLPRPHAQASTAHSQARQARGQSSPALLRDLSFLGSPSGFDRKRNHPRTSTSFDRAKQLFGERSSPVKPTSLRPRQSEVLEEIHDENNDHDLVEFLHSEVPAADKIPQDDARTKPEAMLETEDDVEQEAEADSDDEGDGSGLEDPGIVRITSSDPRAAARAAAILKQHDYDCFTKIVLKQQQRRNRASTSDVTLDDFKRGNRRNTLFDAGITKGKKRASMNSSDKLRRQSFGGVIGDRVYIPGSPVMTLGGLLKEAEKEVQMEKRKGDSPRVGPLRMAIEDRDPFHTPAPSRFNLGNRSALAKEVGGTESDEEEEQAAETAVIREWTKEEWKILDGCFTDERIELAAHQDAQLVDTTFSPMNTKEVRLANADLVVIENVVARFIDIMGGQEAVDAFGWSSDSLHARVKALQNKQRAGHVAPPTTPYTPPNAFENAKRQSTGISVPDFTPLSRPRVPGTRSKVAPVALPPPVGETAPFSNLPDDLVESRKVPAVLLAPRYSHLLDEAIAISRDLPSSAITEPDEVEPAVPDTSVNVSVVSDEDGATEQQAPPSAIKRVKNFMFSYLPTLSKSSAKPARQGSRERRPGLPLPPAEILEKPRGPITTPARPAVPKPKHPKELVNLHHQPVPERKGVSMIPRSKPKRMVELNKVGLPEERAAKEDPPAPRLRRSSGGSVKDLIKGFEERRESLERSQGADTLTQLRRARSIGEWQKGIPGREKTANRPAWKP